MANGTANTDVITNLTAGGETHYLRDSRLDNIRIFTGTCATAAATAAKVVTCAEYDALTAGDILFVKFSYANTASSPTLNVNSKGAKNVKFLYNNSVTNLPAVGYLARVNNSTSMFMYDGTQWILCTPVNREVHTSDSYTGDITGVTAGTGLSGGGTSGSVTLNHSNSVTAQTTQAVYPIKIDAQGHISGYGSAVTIPSSSDFATSTHTHSLTTENANVSGTVTAAGVVTGSVSGKVLTLSFTGTAVTPTLSYVRVTGVGTPQ